MKIMLNKEELISEIKANHAQLPDINELHFDIWNYAGRKTLVMSMIYRNPVKHVLTRKDYVVFQVAQCNLENETPLELQNYGRSLKIDLRKEFPEKKISSKNLTNKKI